MTSTLVLGGARSGKSAYALALAQRQKAPWVMIATAQALDQEMAERIARHKAERGAGWRTVEEPLDLQAALTALAPGQVAVVDCLTLWLSNLMLAERDLETEIDTLLGVMQTREVILISNEVGLGIVPDNALARRFRDAAGLMNQMAARTADRVVLITAGLPLILK